MNNFQHEWAILHADIEKYERFSLVIKLFGVFVCVLSIAYSITESYSIILILILWLQDGIWKTFQKRLETRIMFIENQLQITADENTSAFQLYSQWLDKRQGMSGLIKEYLLSAARPTIAYPYVLLVLLMVIKGFGVI